MVGGRKNFKLLPDNSYDRDFQKKCIVQHTAVLCACY